MDSLILSCDGFSLDSSFVPAFQLRAGECLCLHLPQAMASVEVEQLIRILTGKTPLAEVRLLAMVHWAAPLRNRRHGLLGLFRPVRVVDWLIGVAGASLAQARTILQQLDLQSQCRIDQLPGTLRTLLSVEAAWLAEAQIVVFTTAGLDPFGRERVYQAVSSHFPQGSALHLSFPFLQNGELKRECPTEAMCLELRTISDSSCPVSTNLRTE